jgi:fatty acid desaturase
MAYKLKLGQETKKVSSSSWRVPPELRVDVLMLSRSSLPISITAAAGNWIIVWLNLTAAYLLRPSWLLVVYPIQLVLIARALRAFENLTHEASHHNWYRRNEKINDCIANWMCSYWVGLSVQSFRETHLPHHADFGNESDPCAPRYRDLDLDSLDRSKRLQFVTRLFIRLFTYTRGYWQVYINQRRQLAVQILLHGATMTIGSLVLWPSFWMSWTVYVIVAFVIVLPFLRFWAEASKHRYAGGQSELESTYNNIGKLDRWLIHPSGDGFHLVHHYLASIPHHRLAQAHRLLSKRDPKYRAHRKVRLSIFDEPDRG